MDITKREDYRVIINSPNKPDIKGEYHLAIWARFFTNIEAMFGISPNREGRKENRLAVYNAIMTNAKDLSMTQVFNAYKLFSEYKMDFNPDSSMWTLKVPDLIRIVKYYRKHFIKKEHPELKKIEAPTDPKYYFDRLVAKVNGEGVSIIDVSPVVMQYIELMEDYKPKEIPSEKVAEMIKVAKVLDPYRDVAKIKESVLQSIRYTNGLEYIKSKANGQIPT